jgi:hypothetical protein
MSARYWAFLAVVALCVSVSFFTVDGGRAATADARAVALLPASLGGRHIRERWSNARPRRSVEEGAVYAGPATLPEVQLDFYRNSPVRHNGAVCYIVRGETVVWNRLQEVPLRQGTAQVAMLLLRDADGLRIIAATECAADGCAEGDIRELKGQKKHLSVAVHDIHDTWSFVPVSVAMTRTVASPDDEEAVGVQMEQDLLAVLRELDLTPARRLAALQTR